MLERAVKRTMKSKRYKDGYSMEEMIDRVVYWFFRYEGTRTEDGKEFIKSHLSILLSRLERLKDHPNEFKFNNPDMDITY